MGKETLNEYYCGNTKKSSCKIEKNNLCSICEKQGIPVKSITVKHMVLDELAEQVGDNDYFLCMSEECDITYYNTESKIKFNEQQVKVPIWFKNDCIAFWYNLRVFNVYKSLVSCTLETIL